MRDRGIKWFIAAPQGVGRSYREENRKGPKSKPSSFVPVAEAVYFRENFAFWLSVYGGDPFRVEEVTRVSIVEAHNDLGLIVG